MASSSVTQKINGYVLKEDLKNANSGFSKWGFAEKNGNEYFIKELITPVYPIDESAVSETLLIKRRNECVAFEDRSRYLYNAINGASQGLLVKIVDFFRSNSKYYVVMEKISSDGIGREQLSALDDFGKIFLVMTIARGFANLHSVGVIHFDVKPSNILLKRSASGKIVGKIIDFDGGFFISENLSERELGGDLTYLAPETFLGIIGEETTINGKADIFALGLVFHEYICGALPDFDRNQYEYPYESVLDGKPLDVRKNIMPYGVGDMIEKMLSLKPEDRPTADTVASTFRILCGLGGVFDDSTTEPPTPPSHGPATPTSSAPSTSENGWFHTAGDL